MVYVCVFYTNIYIYHYYISKTTGLLKSQNYQNAWPIIITRIQCDCHLIAVSDTKRIAAIRLEKACGFGAIAKHSDCLHSELGITMCVTNLFSSTSTQMSRVV